MTIARMVRGWMVPLDDPPLEGGEASEDGDVLSGNVGLGDVAARPESYVGEANTPIIR